MALVVGPTHPYASDQLKLQDPNRWSRLLPLMRPSLKAVESAKGQTIVVDTAFSSSKDVLLVAVGGIGNFSSKILSDCHLTAFTSESDQGSSATAEEVATILKSNGFPTANGVVVIRSGSKQELKASSGIAELVVVGELTLDHVLSLLNAVKPEIRESFKQTQALLKQFIKSAVYAKSTFNAEKVADSPTVTDSSGTTKFSSAKAAIEKDLKELLGSNPSTGDSLVYSVHFADINGLSRLEINIIAHEIVTFLRGKGLSPYTTQSTILDPAPLARGWAISVAPLPSTFITAQPKPANSLATSSAATPSSKPRGRASKLTFSDAHVRKAITSGCQSVITAEPTITEYDTIVGDGDCGYTLRDGATQVLKFIGDADLSTLPLTLGALVDDLEVNMGGTSGALYCIFLSSLAQNLWEAPSFVDALRGALDQLLRYTKARLGDRTMLDCLIPFVETLQASGDVQAALGEAEKGVETTKKLEATLGRSSYLAESATRGVPDPGAYGLLKLLEGIVAAN